MVCRCKIGMIMLKDHKAPSMGPPSVTQRFVDSSALMVISPESLCCNVVCLEPGF